MAIITVTVQATFEYDTGDGPVGDEQSALEDVWELLTGGVSPGEFTFTATTSE